MKSKLLRQRPSLRWCIASGWLLWCVFSTLGATTAVAPPESADRIRSRILVERAALDREVRTDVSLLDSKQLELLRLRIAKQAREVSNLEIAFRRQHPTNEFGFQVGQDGLYSRILLAMVSRADAAFLWNSAEGIASCRSKAFFIQEDSLSPERAIERHSLLETTFADAVIAALPLQPENYYGAVRFAERAEAATGRRLAQALVDSPFLSDSPRSAANRILKRRISIGQPAVLKFTALGGSNVDLATLRGKVVLVDFWATYCPPCITQFPELKTLYDEYKGRGLEILGISSDSDPRLVERVLQERGISWPNYASREADSNEHSVAFGVSGIPDCLLIDRDGILRETGATENLESKIKYLLEIPASASP